MKHLLKHFKDLSIHPKNAAELKGLILQLAVQGKLTANWRLENPDVEPASVLLERIQVGKAQLVKDKKIKKEKALPEITQEEIPYELPGSWAWCRLNDVCEYIQRGKSPKYSEEPKIPVVSQKCVQWSGFDISRAKFITEESLEKYGQERFLQEGDLLWNSTGDGTIGRVISFVKTDFDRVVADSHVTVVRAFKQYLTTDYLWIFTASPLIQNLVEGRVSGSTKQTELGTGTVKLLEFSFPPLEEQKAIVSTVNTLFAEVEQLEALTNERIQLKEDFVTSALQQLTNSEAINGEWVFLQQHFATFFTEPTNIKKLRESILNLAVQGKLTTHWRKENPDTEDASVLLERIKAEKAQLVKEKKIKKENPLPKIKNEEMPYSLPDGWVWCNLVTVCNKVTDGFHHTPKKLDKGFRYISATHIKENGILWDDCLYIGEKEHSELFKKASQRKGDILIVNRGAGCGTPAIVDIDEPFSFQNAALIGFNQSAIDTYFMNYFILQKRTEIMDFFTNGGAQPMLSNKILKTLLFPLPSYEEQKAIVEKVNSLMALCDQLEQEIQTSKATQEDWMKSSLREVFATEAQTKELKADELGMVAEPKPKY